MFNSREYEWADISVVLAGRHVTGFRAVEYNPKQEKEAVYAKGNKPHGIQRGNKSYEGSITLLQSEYESLKQACGGDILDPSFDIVVAYGNASKGDAVRISSSPSSHNCLSRASCILIGSFTTLT